MDGDIKWGDLLAKDTAIVCIFLTCLDGYQPPMYKRSKGRIKSFFLYELPKSIDPTHQQRHTFRRFEKHTIFILFTYNLNK